MALCLEFVALRKAVGVAVEEAAYEADAENADEAV